MTHEILIEQINRTVVKSLRINYQPPEQIESEADSNEWLKTFTASLANTSSDLDLIWKGWLKVVREYRGKSWPVPGVVCKAIRDVIAEEREHMPDRRLMIETPRETKRADSEADKLMWEIVGTQIGYQAVLDDLGLFIWEDLRDRIIHGPSDLTETYMRHLKKVHRGFHESHAKTNDVTHLRGLKGMGDHILKKMDALKMKFLAKAA